MVSGRVPLTIHHSTTHYSTTHHSPMNDFLAYWNGSFVPQSQVRLAINDAGFVFGATATDMCRTFRHRLFRLEDHVRRFEQSCRLAQVPQPSPTEQLKTIADELVKRNSPLLSRTDDLALVMFATPGEIGYYLGLPGGIAEATPTLCMHTFPLPFARYRRLMTDGARLVTVSSSTAASLVPPAIKQRSRLHWWLAEQQAHDVDAAASALLLDENGHVTETAAANFLLVRDGKIWSPKRDHILGGISLLVVEELCGELGIDFVEADLPLADCLQAEAAMLSSTPFCLAPVASINGRALACPGPVYGRLLAAWNAMVGVDIRRQIEVG